MNIVYWVCLSQSLVFHLLLEHASLLARKHTACQPSTVSPSIRIHTWEQGGLPSSSAKAWLSEAKLNTAFQASHSDTKHQPLHTGPEFGPLGAGWPAQQQRATSPGAWPASNLPPHLDQRPQSAEPVRPRSAGAIRGHLHVPVDAHMAALGFMADDASPAPGERSLKCTTCHMGSLLCD